MWLVQRPEKNSERNNFFLYITSVFSKYCPDQLKTLSPLSRSQRKYPKKYESKGLSQCITSITKDSGGAVEKNGPQKSFKQFYSENQIKHSFFSNCLPQLVTTKRDVYSFGITEAITAWNNPMPVILHKTVAM